METKEEYNEVPVHFCKNCLSLAILRLNTDENRQGYGVDYCNDCGSTMTSKTHIGIWEDLYKEAYGQLFVKKSKF